MATPPLSVPGPRSVVPSQNSTLPVGVPLPGLLAETVAVNVTEDGTRAVAGVCTQTPVHGQHLKADAAQ